jgi:hypothetical protein
MLTVLHDRDRLERERLLSSDPFQLAAPCWQVRVIPSLPPEYRRISIEELNTMPIKTVEFAEAPRRLKGGSGPSSTTEYTEIMQALRDPKNKGKAFIVTLGDEWKDKPKPEIAFAYALRRYFTLESVNWTAYQSGKNEVTVRSLTTAEMKRKESATKK